ncbi:MAG TPA: hypothetical protein DC063_11035, partial [Arenimonas sp.]|nr:hypothetical protein [Arenimonas sp.]
MFLSLLAWRGLQKPALAFVLVVSAAMAYFMDGFGAVVDRHAVQSVLETDLREGREWLSWQMAAYVVGLGLLPAAGLLALRVRYRHWPRELLARGGFMLAMLLLVSFQVTSGLMATDDIAFQGPLYALVSSETGSALSGLHRQAKWLLLVLIGMHIGAIIYYT